MPEISRFLGIIIAMFYKEHSPPHFHAKYGEYEITVDIVAGVVNGAYRIVDCVHSGGVGRVADEVIKRKAAVVHRQSVCEKN